MADRTFTIVDAATGKKVGEQTVSENFAPHLLSGQRAELVEDKPAKTKAADKSE